jgi:hypothetical protein
MSSLADKQRGIFALWLAVMLPALIALFALLLEWAHLFTIRQQQRTATDAAVIAAAYQTLRHDSASATTAAQAAAALNGFPISISTALIIEQPPLDGFYAGNELAIHASMTHQPPRLLQAIFEDIDPIVSTQATARFKRGACLLALAPTGAERLSIAANANVQAAYCSAQVNSGAAGALTVGNKATVSLLDIRVVGTATISGSASVTPTPVTGAAAVADPMSAVTEPVVGACDFNNYVVSGTRTLTPGTYCGGLRLNANAVATLQPGAYVIVGGLLQLGNNAQMTGAGLNLFLMQGAQVVMNSTAILNLSAAQTGDYAGILLFESRAAPLDTLIHNLPVAQSALIEGLIYLSRSRLNLDAYGNQPVNGASRALAIVARHIAVSGRIALNFDPHFLPSQIRPRVWLVE